MEQKSRALKIEKRVMYTLFFLTFGVMMIIGTTKDLEIDKSLFDYQNSFARFMESYAEAPLHLVRLLACCVLFTAYHKVDDALDIAQSFLPFIGKIRNNKIIRIIIYIIHHIIYVMFLCGAFIGSNEFLNYIGANIQDLLTGKGAPKFIAVILWTIVRIALVIIVLLLMRKIDKKKLRSLEFMAFAGLILYESSAVINEIKDYFHRVRFREMVAYSHALIDANGYSSRGNSDMPKEWVETSFFNAYTPWYKPGNDFGVYSESNSFPSGHTASAAFTMLLPLLATKTKKATKLFIPAFILGFAYTLTTGIMRLVVGAHYLTDIAAAAIIILAMAIVITGIMNILERYSDKRLNRIIRRRKRDEMRSQMKDETEE